MAMHNSIKVTLIIAATVLVIAAMAMSVFNGANPYNQRTISVQGQSQLKVLPDLATVYFSIETNASTAVAAKDKNAEITDALITALVKKGFERKDITTENFNVYPDYSWENGKQESRGFKATHSVKVEMPAEETSKLGDAVDAGINAGALVSYINFELSQEKQNQYKAQALNEATTDARIKAEAIASGLGKKLGDIASVSDSSFDYYPWRAYQNTLSVAEDYAGGTAKAAVSSIQPGEQDVNARISVAYRLN